jgi:hypothetical protein
MSLPSPVAAFGERITQKARGRQLDATADVCWIRSERRRAGER